MALFGSCEHCADYRAQRDRAQEELSVLLAEQTALVREIVAMKRHEVGLMPTLETQPDPVRQLGPKTTLAIEEMMAGDFGLRAHLTNVAVARTMAGLAETTDKDEVDEMVATHIRLGDA